MSGKGSQARVRQHESIEKVVVVGNDHRRGGTLWCSRHGLLPVEVGYILPERMWCNRANSTSNVERTVLPTPACGVAVSHAEGCR